MTLKLFFEINNSLIVLLILTMILTAVQVWFSRSGHWKKGIIIPVIYCLFSFPNIYSHLTVSPAKLIPDYYQAATFFYPSIWLLMIYFILYYHRKYKEAG